MVIILVYNLAPVPDSDKLYVHSHDLSQCPSCSIDLRPFGRRERKVCLGDGSEICLIIRRLRCPCCRRIHHELPDFVIPYKRYEADVIEEILCCASEVSEEKAARSETNKTQTTHDAVLPHYPCETSTAFRLHIWFLQLLFNLNKNLMLQKEILKVLNIPKLSFETLKEIPQGWLKKIFRVMIKIPLFS